MMVARTDNRLIARGHIAGTRPGAGTTESRVHVGLCTMGQWHYRLHAQTASAEVGELLGETSSCVRINRRR